MFKFLVGIAAALVLTGCASAMVNRVNQMSANELAAMPDAEMCRNHAIASLSRFASMKPAFYGELNSRQLVCYGGEALGRGPQAREAAVQLQTIEAIKQAGNNAAYDAMISAGLQMMSGSQPRSAISPMRECTVTNTGFQHNTVDCW